MTRNTQLDGLRGWAALSVAIYHGINIPSDVSHEALMRSIQSEPSIAEFVTKLLVLTFNGSLAVVVFFVLSGKVLLESLLRARVNPAEYSLDFLVKRILRIYPPLWAALLAYVLMHIVMHRFAGWEAAPDWHLVLVNATLTKITMYGVAWTLIVELLAAPLILIGVWAYRAHGAQALFVLLALSLLCKDNQSLDLLPYFSSYGFLFTLGFLTSTTCAKQLAREVPSASAFFVLFLMVYAVAPMRYDSPNVLVFQGLATFLLIVQISDGKDGKLKSFFNNPMSQFLGRVSFSLYLLHPLALDLLAHWASRMTGDGFRVHYLASGIIIGLLTPVLTIPISCLMHRYVEMPSILLGKIAARKLRKIVFGESVKIKRTLQ